MNRGKLWDKYNNISKAKSNPRKDVNKLAKSVCRVSTDSCESEQNDNEFENARIYLLYNFEKNELVKQKWLDCFEYRKKKFIKSNLDEILEEWPIITKTYGSELVKQCSVQS